MTCLVVPKATHLVLLVRFESSTVDARFRPFRHQVPAVLECLPEAGIIIDILRKLEGETHDCYVCHGRYCFGRELFGLSYWLLACVAWSPRKSQVSCIYEGNAATPRKARQRSTQARTDLSSYTSTFHKLHTAKALTACCSLSLYRQTLSKQIIPTYPKWPITY